MPPPADEAAGRRGIRIEIAPRTIFYVLLALAGVWLAQQLWTVIVIITVALVLVGTFDPMVSWFERRGLRRGRALLVIFILATLTLAALLVLTLPPLISQLLTIVNDAPKEREHVLAWLAGYKWATPISNSIRAVPINQLMTEAGNKLLNYGSDVLAIVGYGVTTIFLAIYLLAEPKRANGILYAIVPRQHHVKLARILIELESIVGGYMRGQLITSVSIAVFMFTMLTILRVDDALAISIFAGLTDIIPFVGGILASAPAIIATSSIGGWQMGVVAALCFLYQEFENRILVPRVYGRQLRLPPAAVMVSLLIGGTLLGVLGALLALPIAAGIQMVVRQLRVELPGEEGLEEIRAQDEKAEQVYEALTQGATASDAAVIASELAQKLKKTEAAGSILTTAEMPVMIREIEDAAASASAARMPRAKTDAGDNK